MRSFKLLSIGTALFLVGCASMPSDRGLSDVRGLVTARGGPDVVDPLVESREQVSGLLAKPLTVDSAVRVALLRNPQIRVEYARLGLSQSDVLQASRLSNPTLSVAILGSSAAGDRARIDYGLVQNFTDALFLSARGRLARAELERVKQLAGSRILDLASASSAAYYRAVSAEQVAQMRTLIAKAADASGVLAKRFYDAGNLNELEWKREQAAATQARLEADAALAESATAHADLNSVLGLKNHEAKWSIRAQLPLPVVNEVQLTDLQGLASGQRLDLAAKRSEIGQFAAVRSLASKLRWLGVVEVGVEGERDTDGTHLIGPSFSLQLPIFNQGQASIARIDALTEQAQAELDRLEIDVANDVSTAYAEMVAARTRADRHLQELIPQREAIVARTQELQNYMIVGQFELLAAKKDEYDAYQSYLESVRDYWLARVNLARAVGTRLPSDARIGPAAATALRLPDKPPPMHMHGGQSMENMPGMPMDDQGMKGMEGMEHKDHGSMDHGSMKGMDHGSMDHSGMSKKPASTEPEHQHDAQPADEKDKRPEQPVIQGPHEPHD